MLFQQGGGPELFLIVFSLSLILLFFRWILAMRYKTSEKYQDIEGMKVTIIVPVVDEPDFIWRKVLQGIKDATRFLDSEVFVMCNGAYSERNYEIASEFGFVPFRLKIPSKRRAVREAVYHSSIPLSKKKNGITIILDSDTIIDADSIIESLRVIGKNTDIGGMTPRHTIYDSNQNIIRRISAWMEDERFTVTLRATDGAISCLPGRFLAIRSNLLLKYIDDFVSQTFLGMPCETGDDRYLTQRLIKDGYRTVFSENFSVQTNAPDTLLGFIKQRIRWSRSSIRETILSSSYMWKHPATFVVIIGNVIVRWLFFIVIILFILNPAGIGIEYSVLLAIVFFLLGHSLRQIPHLYRNPRDIFIVPIYGIVSSFILLPVEWYGNITLLNNKWLTRKTTL